MINNFSANFFIMVQIKTIKYFGANNEYSLQGALNQTIQYTLSGHHGFNNTTTTADKTDPFSKSKH